jgi:ParB family chromosome partitioning protein
VTAPAVPRGTKPKLTVVSPVATFDEILLELVDVDDNVRTDVGELDELKASIHELGVIQPIKVTAQPSGRYRVVWGQRRVLACRELGRTRIPAIIEPPSDVDRHGARRSIEQLSENLQRKDLNPIEEAIALREVLDSTKGLTQEALADKLGMSRTWLTATLSLLDAPPAIQEAVRDGTLTAAHAKALRNLSVDDATELAAKAIKETWSAHDTERQAKWAKDQEKSRAAQRATAARHLQQAVEALEKVANRETATIGVADYSGHDVSDQLKAAGWNVVNGYGGSMEKVDQAGSCGCSGVWRVDVPYGANQKVVVEPACNSAEHKATRAKARDDVWKEQNRQREAERNAQEAASEHQSVALAEWLVEHPRDLFSRRLLIYGLVDDDRSDGEDLIKQYLAGEDEEATDDRDDALWDAICAIPEGDLTKVLARSLTDSVLNAWHLSKTVREAIAERVPLPGPAKPAKRKKAAADG